MVRISSAVEEAVKEIILKFNRLIPNPPTCIGLQTLAHLTKCNLGPPLNFYERPGYLELVTKVCPLLLWVVQFSFSLNLRLSNSQLRSEVRISCYAFLSEVRILSDQFSWAEKALSVC